jgi:hypothetical protein
MLFLRGLTVFNVALALANTGTGARSDTPRAALELRPAMCANIGSERRLEQPARAAVLLLDDVRMTLATTRSEGKKRSSSTLERLRNAPVQLEDVSTSTDAPTIRNTTLGRTLPGAVSQLAPRVGATDLQHAARIAPLAIARQAARSITEVGDSRMRYVGTEPSGAAQSPIKGPRKGSNPSDPCGLPPAACPESRAQALNRQGANERVARTTLDVAVGSVAVATSASLLLLSPSSTSPPKSAWVRPYAGPYGVGLRGGF